MFICILNINAQITGQTCIDINGNNLYNEHVYDINLFQLGEGVKLTDPEVGAFSVSASGGIEIVRVDTLASQVIIKSKTGTTKDELFSRWGRGRINVWYSAGNEFDCGYSMGLHISKHFDLTNHDYDVSFQVNGPSCIAPGDTVVFSVPPLVTMSYTASHDTYKWNLGGLVMADESNILYWSSDYSAVTLVAPDFGDIDFVSVVLGSCNNDSHNLLTRSVYGKPATPVISGPACWESSDEVVLSIDNYDPKVTYTWVVNNDTLAINSTAKTIIVNINDNPLFRASSEFEVYVYADPIGGNCFGSVRGKYKFYKGIFKETTISRLKDDTEPCFNSGHQKTLKIDKMGETVVWELPQNWSGIGAAAQYSNNITPQIGAENGVIIVKSIYSECLNTVSYDAYLKPEIDSISGSGLVEEGQTYTYTAHGRGADTYKWIIPDGYSYTPTTSQTIELTVLGNGQSISPIQVKAIGEGSCEGVSISKMIGVAPTTPTSISFKKEDGTSLTCFDINMENTFVIYTDPIDANHAFEWDLGTWGTITSLNPNSNEITVATTALTDGTYTVKVKSTTAAGAFVSNEYSDDFTIIDNYSLLPLIPYPIFELQENGVKVNVEDNDTEVLFLKDGNPYLDNLGRELWGISRYGDIEVGGRPPFVVDVPLESGYELRVIHTLFNGCKVYEEVVGGTETQSAMLKSAMDNAADTRIKALRAEQLDAELFTLYPNPTNNFINISLSKFDGEIPANYKIFSSNGRLVYESDIKSSITNVNVSGWSKGIYIVVVKYGDRTEEKKVIVK